MRGKALRQTIRFFATIKAPDKRDFVAVRNARKIKTLQRLEEESELSNLLSESRIEKVKYLKSFTSQYPFLLRQLFEEE